MLNKINISPQNQKLIVYIFLTLATLAVFWQVTRFDFITLDDQDYIIHNNHIQSGVTPDGFHWAFSTKYFGLWNPLVWLSFMFDYKLYGLNAGGYHLTNLILHILSALLLFWLFNRMTGAVWKSAFVAAFFALHPLHVESVAWIAERKDVLSAFFWILTLCFYVYYTEKPVIKRYLLVLFCFVLALMSKPMVVTLPVVMILLDYWPLKRFQLQKNNLILWQLKEKTLFFILSAILISITLYSPNKPDITQLPLVSRLANAPVSFMTYLGKTFWPHDLAIFYPFPEQLSAWQVLGTIILILIISASVIAAAKRLPYLFAGWLWFVTTLLPVIGIIQISLPAPCALADRYHYLPSIGITVMLAWGIPLLFKLKNTRRKILFPAAIVFLTILAVLSWKQCSYWKNNITLYSRALQVTKDNFLAHNNRGVVYAKIHQYQRAIEDFNTAIDLKQDYANPYDNRGAVYLNQSNNKLGCYDARKACTLGVCGTLKAAQGKGLCL
jgi:tetratricopeptide (TPR) repeat protein